MFSLGTIEVYKDGRILVTILRNGFQYFLWNKEDLPKDHPGFGLFSYDAHDQFCRWVNVLNIEMKKD
jgi:hypothetical protein